jgi:large subunit ribosomal protein L35
MPKQKSHKGIRKRMRKTGRGKILRKKPNSGHLMSGKTGRRRRRLRRKATVHKTQLATYIRLIGK